MNIKTLTPHDATPEVEALATPTTPTIYIGAEAFRDTHFVMDACPDHEVGWLGAVKEVDDGDYLIDRIFLFEQEVSAAHCEMSAEAIGKWFTARLANDPEAKSYLSRIRFWGHLHPGGMDSPSTQDEEQMKVFAHNSYFIRGIFTRQGHCKFSFFDYKQGYRIDDTPWALHMGELFANTARRAEIEAEIKEKVTVETPWVGKGSRGSWVFGSLGAASKLVDDLVGEVPKHFGHFGYDAEDTPTGDPDDEVIKKYSSYEMPARYHDKDDEESAKRRKKGGKR